MSKNNKRKGEHGEQIAKQYLAGKGYSIITANYRCPYGEIDIIAKSESCICFVEVKYRKSLKFGMPREAVTKTKQAKIKETAMHYIFENEITDTDFRFDVIEIIDDINIEITHIQNGF